MRLVVLIVAALALTVLAGVGNAKMSPVVSAKLTGTAEVPDKGAPSGSGIAVINFKAQTGSVCWEFKKVKNVASPSAAHIHKGKKGKAGPVSIALGGKYKAKGCTKAAKSLIEAVETRPGDFYVNVHNTAYPNGAIRGQLVAGMVSGA